jgi:hypothetical protein
MLSFPRVANKTLREEVDFGGKTKGKRIGSPMVR